MYIHTNKGLPFGNPVGTMSNGTDQDQCSTREERVPPATSMFCRIFPRVLWVPGRRQEPPNRTTTTPAEPPPPQQQLMAWRGGGG